MLWVHMGRACGAIVLVLHLAAAQSAEPPPVKQVAVAQPPQYSGTGPRTVIYRRTVFNLTNDKFGTIARGFFCAAEQPLVLNNATVNVFSARFSGAARREIRQLGYGDAVLEQSAFSQSENPSGDYELAGTMRGIESHICTDGIRDNNGGVWLQIRWELFASRQQRVVHTVTTEGSFTTGGKFAALAIDELFERAFVGSLKNALADETMVRLLRSEPAAAASAAPGSVQSLQRLQIARSAAQADAPDAEYTTHRSAVTTIFSGVGTGSGFYIDAEGYLLTNQHVVGDAKYVKVRLATGREIVGEVLRSDRARDVALVKTESVSLRALALSNTLPGVGDELVAIGSPFGETFASSLSKGVLSGVATVREQRWLQSDVKVLPGSSGGPLIRRDGSVVGIVQGGVGQGPGAGVNLFVPIDEALAKLAIDFRR